MEVYIEIKNRVNAHPALPEVFLHEGRRAPELQAEGYPVVLNFLRCCRAWY